MGRLVREMLQQTDPRKNVYVDSMQGWYDASNREVVGIRTFSLLHGGVGIFGLMGMDKLVSFFIVRDLNEFVRLHRKTNTKAVASFISEFGASLSPTSQLPQDSDKLYAVAQSKTAKLWPVFLEFVTKIGQAQLVRRQISTELNFSCKLESKTFSCALDVMNQALINDVRGHYTRPESKIYPGNDVLDELSKYLEAAGISSPITKIYITTEPLEGLPCIMFLFVLAHLAQLEWNPKLSTMTCAKKDLPLDGAPFVVGVITIMKQFHSSHTHTFLSYLGQYVRANINSQASNPKGPLTFPSHVVNVLVFLEEFCKFAHLSRKAIDSLVPSYIFDRFERSA